MLLDKQHLLFLHNMDKASYIWIRGEVDDRT